VIDHPFAPGDAIVVVPASNVDVASFHAEMADAEGNVWIGPSARPTCTTWCRAW
jgi:glutaconate CoA-transferase subunit A